jgi:WD40 repeat protein
MIEFARGAWTGASRSVATVHLWSTADPHNPVPAGDPITGAATWVNAVAFSPDGATLAIASSDQKVGLRLVDVASRRVIATMPHPSRATSVSFSADGAWVMTGANDGTARLWPVNSPTLDGLPYVVSATRFSPDGTRLAVGSGDLRVFDVTDPNHRKQIGPAQTNPDSFSGTLAYSPNGRLLAEGHGRSGTVQLWDVAGGGPPVSLGAPLPAHAQLVETVTFSPDSTLLGTGANDGAVHVLDVTNPQHPVLLSTPGQFNSDVNEVAFSPNGKLLAAGSIDKTVRLWDIRDPRKPVQLGRPLVPGNHYVYSSIFSPDGTILAVSLADSTVRLYDINDPANPKAIGKPLTGPENHIYFLSFTSDGSTVWIWDVRQPATPTVLATLTCPRAPCIRWASSHTATISSLAATRRRPGSGTPTRSRRPGSSATPPVPASPRRSGRSTSRTDSTTRPAGDAVQPASNPGCALCNLRSRAFNMGRIAGVVGAVCGHSWCQSGSRYWHFAELPPEVRS